MKKITMVLATVMLSTSIALVSCNKENADTNYQGNVNATKYHEDPAFDYYGEMSAVAPLFI